MIVVDTSVWVEAVRRPKGKVQTTLTSLLDADEVALALPVRLELIAGIAHKDRRAFRRALSGLPVLMPTAETWRLIEEWIPRAADKGHRFGVTDLLIAGMASEIGGLLWSLDRDFDRLAELGFVQSYASSER